MIGMLGMHIWNAVVQTHPLIPLVVGSHAVVHHVAPLLDKLGQPTPSLLVFGVLGHMLHLQNDLLTHNRTLNSCITMIQHMPLIFLDGLANPILQDLLWGSIFKTKCPLDHVVASLHLLSSVPVPETKF